MSFKSFSLKSSLLLLAATLGSPALADCELIELSRVVESETHTSDSCTAFPDRPGSTYDVVYRVTFGNSCSNETIVREYSVEECREIEFTCSECLWRTTRLPTSHGGEYYVYYRYYQFRNGSFYNDIWASGAYSYSLTEADAEAKANCEEMRSVDSNCR